MEGNIYQAYNWYRTYKLVLYLRNYLCSLDYASTGKFSSTEQVGHYNDPGNKRQVLPGYGVYRGHRLKWLCHGYREVHLLNCHPNDPATPGQKRDMNINIDNKGDKGKEDFRIL